MTNRHGCLKKPIAYRSPRSKESGPGRNKSATKKSNIIIERNGGRKEKFDIGRLTQTISRSGTPFMMAKDIANRISRRVRTSRSRKRGKARERVRYVRGSTVRKMVVQELRDRNRSDIAASYSGEQPDNTRQGRHYLMNENEPVLDNVAANRSKLLYDGSTHFAKSTKTGSKK